MASADTWVCPQCETQNAGTFSCESCKKVRPLTVGAGSAQAAHMVSDDDIAALKAKRSPGHHRASPATLLVLVVGLAALAALGLVLRNTFGKDDQRLAQNVSVISADLGPGWAPVSTASPGSDQFFGASSKRCTDTDPNRSSASPFAVAFQDLTQPPSEPRFAGNRVFIYSSAAEARSSFSWFDGAAFRACLAKALVNDALVVSPRSTVLAPPSTQVQALSGEKGTLLHVRATVREGGTVAVRFFDVAILTSTRSVDLVFFAATQVPTPTDLVQGVIQASNDRLAASA